MFSCVLLLTNYRIQIQIVREMRSVRFLFFLLLLFCRRSRSSIVVLVVAILPFLSLRLLGVSFLFLCVVVVVNLTTLINNDRKMSCSSFFFSKILLFLCTSVLQEDDVDSWGDVGVCVSSGVFIPYV